jgi:hypothetical protein
MSEAQDPQSLENEKRLLEIVNSARNTVRKDLDSKMAEAFAKAEKDGGKTPALMAAKAKRGL